MKETMTTVQHPTQDRTGRRWYATGLALRLVGEAVAVAAVAVVLAWPGYLFSWITAGAAGVVLALPWVRGRAFFAAWAEVPGAFGTRTVKDGSPSDPRTPLLDYVADIATVAVMIAGGAWIAWGGHVPVDRAAAGLAAFAGGGVVWVLLGLVYDRFVRNFVWHRVYGLRAAITAVGWLAWGAFAASVDSSSVQSWAAYGASLAVMAMIVRYIGSIAGQRLRGVR